MPETFSPATVEETIAKTERDINDAPRHGVGAPDVRCLVHDNVWSPVAIAAYCAERRAEIAKLQAEMPDVTL